MSRGAASWVVAALVLAACRPKAAPIRIDASVEPDDGSQGVGVIITKKGLIVEDDPVADVPALVAAAKRHDAGRPPKAMLIVEPSIPVRRVYEVKDGLADIGITRTRYMILQHAEKPDAAKEDAGFAAPIGPAEIPEVPFASGKLFVPFVVRIDGRGATLPGGVVVPRVNGALDGTGLRRAAQAFKAKHAEEDGVAIQLTGDRPYAELIAATDALREDGHHPLFPSWDFTIVE